VQCRSVATVGIIGVPIGRVKAPEPGGHRANRRDGDILSWPRGAGVMLNEVKIPS
jgi:hypothetical protein